MATAACGFPLSPFYIFCMFTRKPVKVRIECPNSTYNRNGSKYDRYKKTHPSNNQTSFFLKQSQEENTIVSNKKDLMSFSFYDQNEKH